MEIDKLVDRFQQKDINAFEKLYECYALNLKTVIYGIVRNNEDAEEILQDVFVKIWNNFNDYNPEKGRFYTWILTISRNMAIDRMRSKKSKKNQRNIALDLFTDFIDSGENLDRNTDSIGIEYFLKGMNDDDKKLLELLYFQGFTYRETSKKINMPIGTVKTKMRKCIADLRKRVYRTENLIGNYSFS